MLGGGQLISFLAVRAAVQVSLLGGVDTGNMDFGGFS